MIDPGCQLCTRLADYGTSLQIQYSDYHRASVADFGARDARLLIVGLTRGLQSANASGRLNAETFARVIHDIRKVLP
ncbi:MAG: hypothetical protein GY815_10140 [Gammaproteobacteria bacterium]|nr:hypothetical protein [Gammaproteobacteria bacterium]